MIGMFVKNLYWLTVILICSLLIITHCQKIPKNGINLKQLTKNGKQKPKIITNANNKKTNSGFLSIKNGNLFYNSRKLFLSGNNVLYINFGQDFGNGNYYGVKTQYESYIKQISNAGGNSIRVLLHGDGNTTPKLDSQGYATGEEIASMVQELGLFLDSAQRNNIFVIINLWSGEYNITSDDIKNLFRQESKLNSYCDKFIKPLVNGLKKKKALAMYDIIADPSATVTNQIVDSNRCFDTQDLKHQFASWTSNNFTMKEMQRFMNRITSTIKTVDPKALVTVLTKEEESSNYCDWCFNYWSDKCLIAGGGKKNGILDIYSFSSFVFAGEDDYWNPMRKKASDYKLGKPLLIGSASANCSISGNDAIKNFNHAFNNGFAGILNWRYTSGVIPICDDSPNVCDSAVQSLRNKNLVKVTIK